MRFLLCVLLVTASLFLSIKVSAQNTTDSTLSQTEVITPIEKNDSATKPSQYFYDKEIEGALQSKLPKEYIIGGIDITGIKFMDKAFLLSLAHLQIGEKITLPGGDQLSKAIQHLWGQNLFDDIKIFIAKIVERTIYLELQVSEKPRLSSLVFVGKVSKTQSEELYEKIGSLRKKIITNQMKRNVTDIVRKYYLEKGYLNIDVSFQEQKSKQEDNFKILYVYINKGNKNKITDIVFFNNAIFDNYKLRSQFSETKVLPRLTLYPRQDNFHLGKLKHYSFKEYVLSGDILTPSKALQVLDPYFRWNIFSGAKFNKEKYAEDQEKLLDFYRSYGYRDIVIEKDTLYIDPFTQRLVIESKLREGKKYYFGDIAFTGNTKFSDSILKIVLDIHKGDVYNIENLNSKLGKKMTPDGMGNDLSSLYMDDGYLFFNVETIETKIYNDTIDYLISIREGPQATIKKINIFGNEKTRDYVVRRELRTYPGAKFSRSDLIRSQRELSNLSFFNPEKIGINPVPNIEEGTVDINYTVEEKSSDQVQLSAGYSGFIGITGTVGLNFNNFSTKHFFEKDAWKPLPSGDGQKLGLQVQANGRSYYNASISFTEPWLTKKRRTSLTLSNSYSFFGRTQNPNTGAYDINYADSSYLRSFTSAISIGRQLKWPDDYFTLSMGLNYTLYNAKNYALGRDFSNGMANNLSLKLILSRNSIDQPLFTRSGSNISLTGQFTLPYSLFFPQANSFTWVEYHKWRFNAEWYLPLTRGFGVDKNRQLILKLAAKYGILGRYNSDLATSPFERFQVGDAGLMNTFSFTGFDVIAQRGYYVYRNSDPKINPQQSTGDNFTMFNKLLAELRYPISTSPTATIFVTSYFEAANGWFNIKDYNPMQLRRSVGVGARFFLPAFGLLGFDYAVGIDRINETGSFGGAAKFNFILGFEPE